MSGNRKLGLSMHDLTTVIIVLWLLGGVLPASWIGRKLGGQGGFTGCAVALVLPLLALAISILAIPLSGITQEFCEKLARLCRATNHNNVWNFVIYPLLAAPVYWLIMLVGGPKEK